MSQIATPGIPKAFLRVPRNPNIRPAEDGASDVQQNPAEASAPAQVTQQPAAPVPPAAPSYTPPTPPPPVPAIDPAFVHQLDVERRRLAEENAQKDQALRNLLMERDELQKVKTEKDLDSFVDSLSFDDLGSVDPEDAKRIAKSVLGITKQNLVGRVEQQLSRQQQQLQATYAQQQHELLRRDIDARNREIQRVHPDFFALQETPEYRAFMAQPIAPHSQLTRDKVAADEYQRGNTGFVIDLMSQLKQTMQSPESVMSVAPVQASSGMSAAPTDNNPPQYTLRDLNNLLQMRSISHDQYREELAKLRATGAA